MKENSLLNHSSSLYEETMSSNDKNRIYDLATFYYTQSPGLDNYWTYQERYISLLEKGAELNHTPSIIRLADTNRWGNDYVGKYPYKAKALYEKASLNGSSTAMLRLASMYESEFSEENEDYKKSLYWIRKAVELNDSEAYLMLGTYYEEGKGVEWDVEKALELYHKGGEEI